MDKQPNIFQVLTHDAYLRAVGAIGEVAEELLRFVLPRSICSEIDWGTLQLAPNSFIDKKLKESLSDLVYTCFFARIWANSLFLNRQMCGRKWLNHYFFLRLPMFKMFHL